MAFYSTPLNLLQRNDLLSITPSPPPITNPREPNSKRRVSGLPSPSNNPSITCYNLGQFCDRFIQDGIINPATSCTLPIQHSRLSTISPIPFLSIPQHGTLTWSPTLLVSLSSLLYPLTISRSPMTESSWNPARLVRAWTSWSIRLEPYRKNTMPSSTSTFMWVKLSRALLAFRCTYLFLPNRPQASRISSSQSGTNSGLKRSFLVSTNRGKSPRQETCTHSVVSATRILLLRPASHMLPLLLPFPPSLQIIPHLLPTWMQFSWRMTAKRTSAWFALPPTLSPWSSAKLIISSLTQSPISTMTLACMSSLKTNPWSPSSPQSFDKITGFMTGGTTQYFYSHGRARFQCLQGKN